MAQVPSMADILIKLNQDKDKMEDALKAIFMNTINRDFNGDFIYKSGVLSNIEIAIGKEKIKEWEDLYT